MSYDSEVTHGYELTLFEISCFESTCWAVAWQFLGLLCYHPNKTMQSELVISKDLAERFRAATRVLVLTGAGISAESGVPTFRGGGESTVWKGMPFDVISSAQMVSQDLAAVWEWFDYRRELLKSLQPNPAHVEIAKWQSLFSDLKLVTQNIDGLHQLAGSKDVIELHGSIWRSRCTSCNSRQTINREGARADACVSCADRVRPDVVLFGELLPAGAF